MKCNGLLKPVLKKTFCAPMATIRDKESKKPLNNGVIIKFQVKIAPFQNPLLG